MKEIKRIGVLTSGGDCSGLNAVIRAVVLRAVQTYHWEVFGMYNSTNGLISRPMQYKQLTVSDFDFPFARLGGTMLGTNNSGNPNLQMTDGVLSEISSEEVLERFKKGVEELQLDALVVIGGDGSMAIIGNYCAKTGISMIGIPKTIDNDAPATEYAVGFSTAVDSVVDAMDRLTSTARSHNRVMIVEVMGRGAGHLALESAIAGFSDVCLIPEIPYTYEGIVKKLREVRKSGRNYSLVTIAEGIEAPDGKHVYALNGKTFGGVSNIIADRRSKEEDHFNVRVTVLGHIQRGGDPNATDRVMASAYGVYAVDSLAHGKTNQVVCYNQGKIEEKDLEYVLKVGNNPVDPKGCRVQAARGLGIYVGEEIK